MTSPKAAYQSRAAQVADALRQKLRAGHWNQWLPPERALSEQTGVGRRTIRAALEQLQQEGWILERSRQGTRIAPPSQRRHQNAPRSVGMIFRTSNVDVWAGAGRLLDEMRKVLESRNIRLDFHRVKYLEKRSVSASFLQLMQKVQHDGWIINSPPQSMQQWFRDHGIPAMVYGMNHPEVDLPHISPDYQASSRHAAGEMLRLGHRHLAMILPTSPRAEDMQSLRGFESALESVHHCEATFYVAYHDGTVAGGNRLVDRLLKRRPRPTAWLVAWQGQFFHVATYLLYLGIRIPQEISLVSRNSDIFIDNIYPEPTRYRTDVVQLARRAARLAIRVMEGPCHEQILVMPDFIPGATLALAPADPA